MKRARELELVVAEIVEEGKAKDEKGAPLYPVMQEPLVIALFGAADALLEVLKERPIVVLNSLQVNKPLEAFLNRFENLWTLLIDVLVEREMGAYAADIYPFIVVQKHRLALERDKQQQTVRASFMSACDRGDGSRPFLINYLSTCTQQVNPVFYVSHHDSLTRLFMALLDRIQAVRGFMGVGFSVPTGGMARFYIRPKRSGDNDDGREFAEVALFPGCCVFAQQPGQSIEFEYSLDDMLASLLRIRRNLAKSFSIDYEYITQVHREALAELKQLTTNLIKLLDEGATIEPLILLKLDKNTAQPYRTLLYDSAQGLVKTWEAQKNFFISILKYLRLVSSKEELIEKYGQPLQCALCHCETHSVDPLLMRAFCSNQCRETCLFIQ